MPQFEGGNTANLHYGILGFGVGEKTTSDAAVPSKNGRS